MAANGAEGDGGGRRGFGVGRVGGGPGGVVARRPVIPHVFLDDLHLSTALAAPADPPFDHRRTARTAIPRCCLRKPRGAVDRVDGRGGRRKGRRRASRCPARTEGGVGDERSGRQRLEGC